MDNLPDLAVGEILQRSFAGMDAGLVPWLRLSLVCRQWRRLMLGLPVDLVFRKNIKKQAKWLVATKVPLRSVTFHRSHRHDLYIGTGVRTERVIADSRSFAASRNTLEAVHGFLLRGPAPCLSACRSLKQVSLVLADNAGVPTDAPLSALPDALESLGVETMRDTFQAMDLQQLTRLQTLSVEGHDGSSEVRVHLAGLPAAVQRLSISRFRTVDVRSWPSTGPPAYTELRARLYLRLHDVLSQSWSCNQPSGCQLLQLQTSVLTIIDDHRREQAGQDALSGLLRLVRGSQAATVVLDPTPYFEEETYACVHVAVEHDRRVVSTWQLRTMPKVETLWRELQQQCGSYGLRCDPDSNGRGICISRTVC